MTRHDDASILSCMIDQCSYSITQTTSSQLHEIKIKIKNTSKQYLRVKTKHPFEVWVCLVDKEKVKPSSEGEDLKTILIPIPTDKLEPSLVELSMSIETPMKNGSIDFSLVNFDSPTNILLLSLWLPLEYRYKTTCSLSSTKLYFHPLNNSPLDDCVLRWTIDNSILIQVCVPTLNRVSS